MKNLLNAFRLRRRPVEPSPPSSEDIDLDRVVWDPAYRRTAKELLKAELESSDAETEKDR